MRGPLWCFFLPAGGEAGATRSQVLVGGKRVVDAGAGGLARLRWVPQVALAGAGDTVTAGFPKMSRDGTVNGVERTAWMSEAVWADFEQQWDFVDATIRDTVCEPQLQRQADLIVQEYWTGKQPRMMRE